MPLTTTAIWPALVDGRKAKASDVEYKFDWLEGDQMPMVNGNMTNGVYNIGSATYKWDIGYFSQVRTANLYTTGTQTSEQINANIKAYSYGIGSGGTVTAETTSNISSIAVMTTGVYRVSFTTPFANNTYAALATVVNNASGGGYACTFNHTLASVDVYNFNYLGAAFATRFDFLATGAQ